jgi:macrophage erythroblast attacher
MQTTDSALDYSYLRVPFVEFKDTFKSNRRDIEKQLNFAQSHIKTMTQNLRHLDRPRSRAALEGVLQRLKELRSRMVQQYQTEDEFLSQVEARAKDMEQSDSFAKRRLTRMIVDYIAREKLYDVAELLSSKASIDTLVDTQFFRTCDTICSDLDRHSLSMALEWCKKHRSSLTSSPLEFQLKLQNFLEMIKQGRIKEAINFCKQLGEYREYFEEVKRASVLALLYSQIESFPQYQDLLSDDRWTLLQTLFRKTFLEVYSMPTDSLLSIALHAGLAALKTPLCAREDARNENCPTCQPTFAAMSRKFPCAYHAQSSLICRVLSKPMDDTNPPMVLPNGQVYSTKGLQKMTKGRLVTCIATGRKFDTNSVRKVYML